MENHKAAIDAYIARSATFAIPILEHWRKLVHIACPDVVEVIKWGIPHFDYRGDFMCVMASYKTHCSFTFLKGELMSDPRLKANKNLKPIQRFLGKIAKIADLPSDEIFIGMLAEAMELNEKGIKVVAIKSSKPSELETPGYFSEKLATMPGAKEIFDSKSNSFRKEYIVWITDAKTEATRQKRMDEALEWIAEGKGRFWKFKK